MTFNFSVLRRQLALFLLASTFAVAQENTRKIEFRVMRFDPSDRPTPTFFAGNTQRVEIEAFTSMITGPYKADLRDNRFLDFYETKGGTVPSFSTEISPSATNDLLATLIREGDSHRVELISLSAKEFRGGDRCLINLTQSQLGVKFGDAKAQRLKSGKMVVVKDPRTKSDKLYPIDIREQQADKTWKAVLKETWSCDERFRTYLFIYRSKRTKHLAFHSIRERLD